MNITILGIKSLIIFIIAISIHFKLPNMFLHDLSSACFDYPALSTRSSVRFLAVCHPFLTKSSEIGAVSALCFFVVLQ